MKAFVDTPISKEKFLEHLKWHQDNDRIEKGHYGEEYMKGKNDNFCACAVGCSLNSIAIELGIDDLDTSNHFLYQDYLNVPAWLARVEDRIFEGLPDESRNKWPLEFGQAINKGADLEKIKPAFMIFVLESVLPHVQGEKHKQQREAVENVIALWKRNDIGSGDFRDAAARAAAYAACAAAYAADAAARAARAADAADAAADAADAADAAARAAYAAGATADAADAAYEKFADKLLELMRECK